MANWSIPVSEMEDMLNAEITVFIKKLGFKALASCILKTPVDTGRLRGGWLLSWNEPSGYISYALDKAGSKTLGEGRRVLESGQFETSLVLQNNVEYAVYVNDGTPNHRAHRMIERTMIELGGL